MLAGSARGVPGPDDPARPRAPTGRVRLDRVGRRGREKARSTVRRGPCRDRDDVEELRHPEPALGPAAVALARGRPLVVPGASRAGSRRHTTCWRPGAGTSPTSEARGLAAGASSANEGSRIGSSVGSWNPPRCGCRGGSRARSASSTSNGPSMSATRARAPPAGSAIAPRRSSARHPVVVGSFLAIVIGAVVDPRPLRFRAAGRRGPAGVPVPPRRVLVGARLGVSHDPAGRAALGEPRSRSARWAFVADARQHQDRPEGRARRRPGARRDPGVPRRGEAHGTPRRVGARGRRLRRERSHAVVLLGRPSRPPRRARGAPGDLRAHRRPPSPPRSPPTDDGASSRGWGSPWRSWSRSCPGAVLAVALLIVVQLVGGSGTGSRARLDGRFARGRGDPALPVRPHHGRGRRSGPLLPRRHDRSVLAGSAWRRAAGPARGWWPSSCRWRRSSPSRWSAPSTAPRRCGPRPRRSRARDVVARGGGWLPEPLSNPLAFLAVAATAEVMLVAYGVSSAVTGLGREAFGMRQVLTGMLAVALGGGLRPADGGGPRGRLGGRRAWLRSGAAGVVGAREPGQGRLPRPVDGSRTQRILPRARRRPPGAWREAGPATVRYGLTDRDGVSALDIGRSSAGPGPRSARRVPRGDPLGHDPPRRGAPRPLRRALRRGRRRRPADGDAGCLRRAGRPRPDARRGARGLSERGRHGARRRVARRSGDPRRRACVRCRGHRPHDACGRGAALTQVAGWVERREGQRASVRLHGVPGRLAARRFAETRRSRRSRWATGFPTQQAPVAVRYGAQLPGHDPGLGARGVVGDRPVGDEEAGGPMRARGQGFLTLLLAGVVAVGGVAFDRLGPRGTRARPRRIGRDRGLALPARGRQGLRGHGLPRESR